MLPIRFGLVIGPLCLLLTGWTFDVRGQTLEAEGEITAQAITSSGTLVLDRRELGIPGFAFSGLN